MDEWIGAGQNHQSHNPTIQPSALSDFHFAVRAGNPDLFRARGAGGFPIHGAAHDVSHLGEPPLGPGAPVPGYRMTVPVQL